MHKKLRLSKTGQEDIKQQRDQGAEQAKSHRRHVSKEQIYFEMDAEIRLKAGEVLGQGKLVASTLSPKKSGNSGQTEIEYARMRKRWQREGDYRPLTVAATILERVGLEALTAPTFLDWQNFLDAKPIPASLFRAFCEALELPCCEIAKIPSEMTWKRFLQRTPISSETFQAFCQALHLDWEAMVDSTIDLGEAPDLLEQFFGRQAELKYLESQVFKQRLIIVCGQGGIGKSLLVRQLIDRMETKSRCSAIIWRSLKQQPTLKNLLTELSNFLFQSPLKQGIDGTNHTLVDAFLNQFKKQKKCLIVLDDWEAIIPSPLSGSNQSEYENYLQFIQAIQQNHQNCFLLLSRVDPNLRGLSNLGRFNLGRLKPFEVRQFLQYKGVSCKDTRLERFCDRYGNPKFIEFAIQQLNLQYDLDLSRVGQTTLLFSEDLKSFLYSQINQISESSQERLLIYALVIRRGIATDEQLFGDCGSIMGIGNLGRLGWLEYDSEYTKLDPVILKYMTQQLIEKIVEEIHQFISTHIIHQEHIFHKLELITTFETDSDLKNQQAQQILKPILQQLSKRFEEKEFHQQLQENLVFLRSHNLEIASRNLDRLIALE